MEDYFDTDNYYMDDHYTTGGYTDTARQPSWRSGVGRGSGGNTRPNTQRNSRATSQYKSRASTRPRYNARSLYTTVAPRPNYGLDDIKNLCQNTAADILPDFLLQWKDFQKFISLGYLDERVFFWVMALAIRTSESTFHKLKKEIILDISYNESFMNSFETCLYSLSLRHHTHDIDSNQFWDNFIKFTTYLIKHSPSKSGCDSLLEKGRLCLTTLGIDRLHQEIDNLLDRNIFRQQPSMIQGVPDNFRQISVLPNKSEIIVESQIFLRPNIIYGPYKSIDDYLDIQFRLLREDCLSNLRQGVVSYRRNSMLRRYDNIRVYKNVKFLNFSNIKNQIGYCVQWQDKSAVKTKNNYLNNKRFMFGTLLLFTSDDFNTIIFATVLGRDQDLLAKGQIMVTSPISDGSATQLYNKPFLMIESEVYFEPYSHVLKALQSPSLAKNFPMKQYIIDAHAIVSHPSYLTNSATYNIRDSPSHTYNNVTIPVLDMRNWPEASVLNLNPSQCEAFQLALTKEFAIIQGPPGTGKTYLGLKVARTLLTNSLSSQKKNQILVICYTNHALDQFLEGLLNVTKKIVRIGGQSRNTKLDEYNITNLRKKQKKVLLGFKTEYNTKLKDTMDKICQLKKDQQNTNIFISLAKFTSWLRISMGLKLNQKVSQWLFGFQIPDELIDESKVISYKTMETKMKEIGEKIKVLEAKIEKKAISETEKEDARNCLLKLGKNIETLQRAQSVLLERLTPGAWANKADVLNKNIKLHILSIDDRWALYYASQEEPKATVTSVTAELQNLEMEYKDAMDIVEELRIIEDRTLLAEAQVIGMTTTSAARLQPLLQCLRVPIVIIEEAAEVFEAHIVASLTEHCQHLLLIGDHQQLRPSCASYEIGKQYNLQISLFERMIKNGVNCKTLGVQHRMRPEIASLISPIIYKNLENHSSVEDYPPVKGVLTNLYFIDHNHYEAKQSIAEDMGRSNTHEANFLISLAIYLRQQGYQPEEITILTAYNGQMFLMRNMQKEHEILHGVLITAVDNYQGEENKIILLSLVRSNPKNIIGFLSIENRVCVALSRAKEGLYIIGNMNCLENKSKLWKEISNTLHCQDFISNELHLECQKHHVLTEVKSAEDFRKVPGGNCLAICNELQNCGHLCKRPCHTRSESHANLNCLSPCDRTVCQEFIIDHKCPLKCWQKCQDCFIKVLKQLPCGHFEKIECSTKPEDYKCLVPVEVVIPSCGHKNVIFCHENVGKILCREPCLDRLVCGHSCAYACHIGTNPEHEGVVCENPCARRKNGCSARKDIKGHMCPKTCFEECPPCTEIVKKKRTTCSHSVVVECNASPDSTMCKEKCARAIPGCGHHCTLLCGDRCVCAKKISVQSIDCSHTVKVLCGTTPTRYSCDKTCDKLLNCGHPCKQSCKDVCQVALCVEMVPKAQKSPCGHPVLLPCNVSRTVLSEHELLNYCKAKCTALLECGDMCGGDCSSCYQGRIHIPCKAPCTRTLLCGHKCEVGCSEFCPPCKKRCEVKCGHSQCSALCSNVCDGCVMPCQRECPHRRCTEKCYVACSVDACEMPCSIPMKCMHRCRGLCGELCPDVCNICDPDNFPEDFITLMPFEDDDILIKIVDCSHIMEVGSLDSWMNTEGDGSIMVRTCPICKTPIINTARYERQIKGIFDTDIREIKKRISGDKEQIKNELNLLLQKIIKIAETPEYKTLDKQPNWLNLLEHIKDNLQKGERKLNQIDVNILQFSCQVFEMLSQVMVKTYTLPPGVLSTTFDRHFNMIFNVVLNLEHKLTSQLQNDLTRELKLVTFVSQYLSPQKVSRNTNIIQQINSRNALNVNSLNYSQNLINYFQRNRNTMLRNSTGIVNQIDASLIIKIMDMNPFDEAKAKDLLKNHVPKSECITIEEKNMIVKAMGLSQGHWYKCPNGHYYCIGNCGQPNQSGTCPECKKSIGRTGGGTGLAMGNTRASDMLSPQPSYIRRY